MEVKKKLSKAIKTNQSVICCGLDPDLKKFPIEIAQLNCPNEEKVFIFLRNIIDIVSPHVCSFKIQKAFFDFLENGKNVLRKTINYIHLRYPELVVIIDCKIGDIDNTMKIYLSNIFEKLNADGVVVNPYMGDDVFSETDCYKDKLFLVLCKTSNINSKSVQNLRLENGTLLWEKILNLTLNKWNKNNNLIPILSSNEKIDFSNLKIPKDTFLFIAGFGNQGGDRRNMLNFENHRYFINSSRLILYPYKPSDANWRTKVLESVIKHKNEFK